MKIDFQLYCMLCPQIEFVSDENFYVKVNVPGNLESSEIISIYAYVNRMELKITRKLIKSNTKSSTWYLVHINKDTKIFDENIGTYTVCPRSKLPLSIILLEKLFKQYSEDRKTI